MTAPTAPSVILKVRIPPEVHEALLARAAAEGHTPSSLARFILARGLSTKSPTVKESK